MIEARPALVMGRKRVPVTGTVGKAGAGLLETSRVVVGRLVGRETCLR